MNLLVSTDRADLTSQCIGDISSRAAARSVARSILIVPEQTKMDMERALFALPATAGLMLTEVLSFRRLAWRLLGEVGLQPVSVVDPVGQAMLIQRVLRQNQGELRSFGHLADKQGFIREAAAALGDLKRYQIGPDDLQAASQAAAKHDRALENKTHDLAILLRQYDLALSQAGLADAEDDLNRLADLLNKLLELPRAAWPWPWRQLEWLRDAAFWVCGFAELRDFTPQEDAILLALDRLAEQVSLSVAADTVPFDRDAIEQGEDCFYIGRKTAWRLLQNFPQARIIRLPGRPMAADQDDLPWSGQDRPLTLVRANGADDEMAWLAGEIRRLVQSEGYRYRDISLAVCDMPGYAPRLQSACREYGLPLFLDSERPLGGTPLARFILGLLDIGLYGWTRNHTLACLRSGLTDLTPDETDVLENRLIEWGLFRPGRFLDDRQYPDSDLIDLRNRACARLRDFLAGFRSEAAGGGKCRRLKEFCLAYDLPGRISRRSESLLAEGEREAAVALTSSWNELLHILEQMAVLQDDLPLSAQAFRDMLAAGMDSASGGVIPTALDQIMAGSLRRAMLRRCRVLFIIGAAAAFLPPAPAPEGLLKDLDRQSLSASLNRQLPSSARDQVFADAFTINALLNLPTDRLCLTAPDPDTSIWFRRLAALRPAALQILPEQPEPWDPRLNGPRPAYRRTLREIRAMANVPVPAAPAPPRPAGDQAAAAAGREVSVYWRSMARILAGYGWTPPTAATAADQAATMLGLVPSELVRGLYGSTLAMSVSQLETYAACPFQHLANYLLGLQERKIWQPQVTETGTLLHGIAEVALNELRRDLAGLDPTDSDSRRQVLESWLASDLAARTMVWLALVADREGLGRFLAAGLFAAAGRKAHRLATASLTAILNQYHQSQFRPALLEWAFGPGEASGLLLDLPDSVRIAFRGKVDRIDLQDSAEGRQFRIVDYKSGEKAADFDSLYHGLSLQLPAYLEAFRRYSPDSRPVDAAYFHFDKPVIRLDGGQPPDPASLQASLEKRLALQGLKLEPDDLERLCRHTLKQATRLAGELLAGDFQAEPRKLPNRPLPCTYCDFASVCAFDTGGSGYRRLEPLRCRLNASGRAIYKRQEMAMRLREAEANPGEGDNGTHL